MASKSLGTLTIDLIAKIGGFVTGMNQAERQANKSSSRIEKRISDLGSKIDGTFKNLGAAIIGYLSFQTIKAGFDQLISSGLEYGDKIDEMAQQLQMSAERLQEINFAAGFTGVGQDEVQAMLGRLSKAMASAMDEGSRFQQLFSALGVSVIDPVSGKLRDTADVLEDLSDVFKDNENATAESALAMELFGRNGAKAMEFLNLGKDGMRDFATEAQNAGLILSGETAAAVAGFQDNLDKATIITKVMGAEIVATMLPALEQFVKWLSTLTAEYRESHGQAGTLANAITVLGGALNIAAGIAKATGNAFDVLKLAIGTSMNVVQTALGQFTAVIKGVWGVIKGVTTGDGDAVMSSLRGMVQEYKAETAKFSGGQDAIWRDFQGPSRKQGQEVGRQLATGVEEGVKGKAPEIQSVLAGLANAGTKGKTGGGRGGAGRSGKSDAERAAEEARRAQEKLDQLFADAMLGYEQTIFMLGKEGEEAKALWDTEKGRYADLSRAQKDQILAQAKIVDQREKEHEAAERFNDLVEDRGQYLADLEFQASLIGKSREEQELMNVARELEIELQAQSLGMTQQQIEALRAKNAAIVSAVESNQQLDKSMRQQVQVMDEIRGSFSNALSDWMSGTASFKDAFLGALDSINQRILQMISDNLMEQLFGGFGTSGAGSTGGNWFSSLFGGLFGGGKANGGHVSAGSFQRVNERGPELLTTSGGKQYLLMGDNSGTVTPNHMGGKRGGFTQSNTFVVQGRIDRRTQLQIAQEAGRRANNAQNRG